MKVFSCRDHAGFWPVGTASVIVAPTKTKARMLLRAALLEAGLSGHGFTLQEVPLDEPRVLILNDGDY